MFKNAKSEKAFLVNDETEDQKRQRQEFCKNVFSTFANCLNDPYFTQAIKDMHYCIHKNRWSKYFQNFIDEKTILSGNWCGIEQEIKHIIYILEQTEHYLDEKAEDNKRHLDKWNKSSIEDMKNPEKNELVRLSPNDYYDFRKKMREEFDRFSMALGIYIEFFACQREKNIMPKDIRHSNIIF